MGTLGEAGFIVIYSRRDDSPKTSPHLQNVEGIKGQSGSKVPLPIGG